MKQGWLLVAIAGLWLGLIGCDTGPSGGDRFRFTYNPPDSVTFVVELSMRRDAAQEDAVVSDSTWSLTTHTQVARDYGYDLIGITDTVVILRDHQPIADPVVHMFATRQVTYAIDSTGRAFDVRGYDDIFANLDSILGPDSAALVKQKINPASLRSVELETWNVKFQPFVGLELGLREPMLDTLFPVLPVEGRLPQYQITEIADTVRYGDRLCGVLRVASSTNPAELAELTERTLTAVSGLFGLDPEMIKRIPLRQAGSMSLRRWVVEFETMLTHAEASRQEIFYHELAASGQSVRRTLTEIQEKTFTY
jgi:hypothetical protein